MQRYHMGSRKCNLCDRVHFAKGFCRLHYHRWRTHGDPQILKKQSGRPGPTICKVPECSYPIANRIEGYCHIHLQRFFRYGSPIAGQAFPYTVHRRKVKKRGWLVRQPPNGKWEVEHRSIMEQILGRSLTPGEVVHHKDSNVFNNNPENLQIMMRKEHQNLHNPRPIPDQCFILDCNKRHTARGFCSIHYQRYLRHLKRMRLRHYTPPI